MSSEYQFQLFWAERKAPVTKLATDKKNKKQKKTTSAMQQCVFISGEKDELCVSNKEQ